MEIVVKMIVRNLTPSSFLKIKYPTLIENAIKGGWSKYPKLK
jgi:hypothetical protein